MPIDLQSLKSERDLLKGSMREIEVEQRKLDTEQKQLRQKEIRTKRMLEAVDTLIDVNEDLQEKSKNGGTAAAQPQ